MAEKPIKQTIIDDIEEQIRTGELKPGDKLPSHRGLRDKYAASDTPVKQALAWLEARGVIYTHQGKGTFVAGPTAIETDQPTVQE